MSRLARSAAAVGALVAGALLPLAFVGVAVGADGLLKGRGYNWFFFSSHLSMLIPGICGVLGFMGFAASALLPVRQFVLHPWLKPMVVTALLSGVAGTVVLVVPAATIPALQFEGLHAALCGLALLGLLLAHYMTANPSTKRTS